MPDYGNTDTMRLLKSVSPASLPPGNWVELTRAEYDALRVIPPRYLKYEASAFAEKSVAEKALVDQVAAEEAKDETMSPLDATTPDELVAALGLVVLDEINTLRTRAGLVARTPAQLRNAIRGKLA